jgi:hypothetical protein
LQFFQWIVVPNDVDIRVGPFGEWETGLKSDHLVAQVVQVLAHRVMDDKILVGQVIHMGGRRLGLRYIGIHVIHLKCRGQRKRRPGIVALGAVRQHKTHLFELVDKRCVIEMIDGLQRI